MEEMINKEFEDFQKDLDIRDQKLKIPVKFTSDSKIDEVIQDLKKKEIDL